MASIEWNKVTWYSKLLTAAVFVATFLIAFDLGAISEQVHVAAAITARQSLPAVLLGATTTAVASTHSSALGGSAGAHCGGFIRNPPQCAAGFHCRLGRIADTGGVCIVNANSPAP